MRVYRLCVLLCFIMFIDSMFCYIYLQTFFTQTENVMRLLFTMLLNGTWRVILRYRFILWLLLPFVCMSARSPIHSLLKSLLPSQFLDRFWFRLICLSQCSQKCSVCRSGIINGKIRLSGNCHMKRFSLSISVSFFKKLSGFFKTYPSENIMRPALWKCKYDLNILVTKLINVLTTNNEAI